MYEETEFLLEMIFNKTFRRDIQYLENADKLIKRHQLWIKNNPDKVKAWKNSPQGKASRRRGLNKYRQKRLQTDINFKLLCNLRSRIHIALKRNSKSRHTEQLIGCSIEFLKQYFEKQFQLGMTWENYGEWHIDHIRPCSSFDLSKPEEQCKCFHYTNLQPLWAIENILKSNK